MRFACIKDGVILNIIEASQEFIDKTDFKGKYDKFVFLEDSIETPGISWILVDDVFTAPIDSRTSDEKIAATSFTNLTTAALIEYTASTILGEVPESWALDELIQTRDKIRTIKK